MKLRTVTALAAVLILAASCTSGTEGIFASIEREQKIVSLGGLSKTATVTSMTEFGGTYYATGGKALFSRPVTGTTWDKGTVDKKTEITAVGSTDAAVYAIAGATLYQKGPSDWTAVPLVGGESPYELVPVRTGDGFSSKELLVVTTVGSPAKKNVVYRISGTTLTALDLSASAAMDLGAPVGSAVFDGTNYYLASQSFLWQVNGGFTAATKVSVSGAPLSEYSGLLYTTTGDALYLSTGSVGSTGGGVYSATSRGSSIAFTGLTNGTGVKVGSTYPVSFGQFLYNDINDSVWVATGATTGQEGTGYMEITAAGLSQTPTTDGNNYTSSAIKTFSIGTLFRSPTTGAYFLGTVAHGLWTWDSTKKVWGQQ